MRFSLLGPKKEGPCAAAGRTPVGYGAGVQIPTDAGQIFRGDAGRDSDVKPDAIPT
jgi:hypothetical protein